MNVFNAATITLSTMVASTVRGDRLYGYRVEIGGVVRFVFCLDTLAELPAHVRQAFDEMVEDGDLNSDFLDDEGAE